jgi:hypothetical protein
MTQQQTFELALGRILRMGSRPSQPGDIAEYERCRKIIMDVLDPIEPNTWDFLAAKQDTAISYVRDRNRGAQGD